MAAQGRSSSSSPSPAIESSSKPVKTVRAVARALFSRNPLHWVGAALVFAVVAGLGGFGFAASGVANISAIPPHPEGWAHFLHFTSERAFAFHADAPPSDEPLDDPALVMRGAAQFAIECSNCHGAPGYGQSPVALSMRPEPPGLMFAAKTYSSEKLFWVIQNGVRYTSMPAWPVTNRPDEVWALVAFLKAMPSMDRERYTELARGDARREEVLARAVRAPTPEASALATSLAPFVPTREPHLDMPGDPQDPYATEQATAFPRIGFMETGMGEEPVRQCIACHGADGTGRPGGAFPNLTLQSPQYLYNALKAYATGQRQSGVMWPIAASLKDEDMRALAVRFGKAPPVARAEAVGADVHEGSLLAHGVDANGNTRANATDEALADPKGVPQSSYERCTSCHLNELYLDRVIPRIDGQNAPYIRLQMNAFKRGGRGDTSSYNPMVKASHDLTSDQIRALGDYYASRSPMSKALTR